MRRRNPTAATWIALAAGGLVGYGIYRVMTAPQTAAPTPAPAVPPNLQNVQAVNNTAQSAASFFGQ